MNLNLINILFVCHGNICRSPMAEFVFKKLINERELETQFLVDSVATSTEELGNDIYPPAKRCLSAHGVPYCSRRARQITKADIANYDYIIAMENYNIKNLTRMFGPSEKYSLLLDYTNRKGNISDPWYTGDFETVYNEIVEGCKGLLDAISQG